MANLRIRLLGPLSVCRDGAALALPGSRKVRALLAYLALATRPLSRSHLCELLWDAPADPRGELRWCLSKIRGLVDAPGRKRLLTLGDALRLELEDCEVDALEVAAAAQGLDRASGVVQRRLLALFAGDFLEGTQMEASPLFDAWLTAQRRQSRARHTALLEHLSGAAPDHEALPYLDKWRELAPFDERVHQALLGVLARSGRLREAAEHLAQTTRLFEDEGLDTGALREALRAAGHPLPAIMERGLAPARSACRDAASNDASNDVNGVPNSTPNNAGDHATIEAATSGADEAANQAAAKAVKRRSIAVMPFIDRSVRPGARGGAADALASDVITRLAKLRSLFVIAQGTVFALHERGIGAEEASRMLDVDYVVGGSVRAAGGRIEVRVELVETRGARIVWAEAYDQKAGQALAVLDEIGNRIVASIAAEIETRERNLALLKPPETLDAWEAYHRGLWHMYRYRKDDNQCARRFFQHALQLDPAFSRAHAGLSFTHFQDAFQNWEERAPNVERAYAAAAQGVMADERDPAVHWAMGRALWLRCQWDESEESLERSVELSPNFALGHYNLSFLRSVVGSPQVAIDDADLSRRLSPYDPMMFGMLATRAMSLVRLGRFEEAAYWGTKAAARPNAFPHIHAIASYSLALAGRVDQARGYAEAARRVAPDYDISRFLLTFPFEPEGEALFRKGARLVGMG